MHDVASNGHGVSVSDPYAQYAVQAETALGDEVGRMRDLLASERATGEQLRALLDASKARERRLERAITYLTGDSAASSSSSPATRAHSGKTTWQPSESTIARALEGLLEHTTSGDAITKTDLAGRIGMGGDTVAKCMEVLRERDQVRITGKTRGGGRLYLPMPDVIAAHRGSDAA